MKNNKDLINKYNHIYQTDQKLYFSKYLNGIDISETNKIIIENLPDLTDKVVVDLGCGEGELISQIAKLGAKKAIGIDYSLSAIEIAKKSFNESNLYFKCSNINDFNQQVDIIISNGTLEHLDNPLDTLEKIRKNLKNEGLVFITCPHFYNLRGFIWVTLNKLLDVPMSLTDIHNITPADIEFWAKKSNLKLTFEKSYDYSRASGNIMLTDMQKRLMNALNDANLNTDRVGELLNFCENFFEYQLKYPEKIKLEGMSKLYILTRT